MSQGNVSYDYLILTTGLQYYRPQFQQEVQAQQRGYKSTERKLNERPVKKILFRTGN